MLPRYFAGECGRQFWLAAAIMITLDIAVFAFVYKIACAGGTAFARHTARGQERGDSPCGRRQRVQGGAVLFGDCRLCGDDAVRRGTLAARARLARPGARLYRLQGIQRDSARRAGRGMADRRGRRAQCLARRLQRRPDAVLPIMRRGGDIGMRQVPVLVRGLHSADVLLGRGRHAQKTRARVDISRFHRAVHDRIHDRFGVRFRRRDDLCVVRVRQAVGVQQAVQTARRSRFPGRPARG